jgi:uncharacterized RmlC-like cupin family protein
MRRLITLIAAISLLPAACFGWGREGHQVIATVAEDHLDETTKVMIQSLIGNNHLYSVANWGDEVRKERRETAPWHYVNIPLGSQYNPARDCPQPHSCVVAKIKDFMAVLTDKNAPREQRAEALRFIVHFVGDIHQPLHAVKEAAGGNHIHVQFLESNRCGRYDCSLHGVWDTSLIQHTGLNRQEYADRLELLIKTKNLTGQDGGTPGQWGDESLRLAQAAWVRDGANLDEAYYQREIKVVDRQMALAGLRLAKLLNDTIGKVTPRDFATAQPLNSSTQTVQNQSASQTAKNKNTTDSNLQVWVNTSSGVYHCPATRSYGATRKGEYMTEAEARKEGYRPANGKSCQ